MKSFFLISLLFITVPTVTSLCLMNKFHGIAKMIKRNNQTNITNIDNISPSEAILQRTYFHM